MSETTYYAPQPGAWVGRPPCANCGAAQRLHKPLSGARATMLECPVAYRPGTPEEARRELAAAIDSGDTARIFVARGNLQRLEGRTRR